MPVSLVKNAVKCTAVALGITAMVAVPFEANALEVEDYDSLVEQAANTCMHYVGKTGEPALRSTKIEIVQVVLKRNVLLCPDSTLPKDTPVIWYGNHKAMVWNPEIKGATQRAHALLDSMTRDDSFPPTLKIWDVSGKEVKGALVPEFRVNCPSSAPSDCLLR